MGMNDENEIIKFGCDKCQLFQEGTYKELFGDLQSLALLPKMVCSECGSNIELMMTGKYKITKPTNGFEQDMAYPQYQSKYGSHTIISTNTWIQLQNYVLKMSNEKFCGANAEVKRHWAFILAGKVPFGMLIVKEEQDEEEA